MPEHSFFAVDLNRSAVEPHANTRNDFEILSTPTDRPEFYLFMFTIPVNNAS